MRHYFLTALRVFCLTAALLVSPLTQAGEPETYNYKQAMEAMQAGDNEKAMTLFEQETKTNPKNAYPYAQMGYITMSQDDYDSAISYFSKALRLFEKDDMKANVQVYCYRALIYFAKENEKNGMSDLRAAEKLSTSKVTDIIIAKLYGRMGQTDAAIAIYKKRLALDPGDPELIYMLGDCYTEKDEYATAIDYYTRAIGINDQQSDIYTSRCVAYFMNGDAQMAVSDCLKAVERGDEQEPNCLSALTLLVDTTMTRNLIINGMRPIAETDTTGKMANYLAQVYERNDSTLKEALHYYRLAAKLNPNSGFPMSLANFYKSLGFHEEAIKTTEESIKTELAGDKNPQFLSSLYYKLSGYQYRNFQADDAMTSVNKAIEYENDAAGHVWRAYLYLLKGDYTAALADYAKATELDEEEYTAFAPNDHVDRGYAYLQTGQTELAEASFRKAIEMEEDAPEKGTILAQHFLGLDDRAKENAATYLENNPEKAAAQVHVATLYALLGDKTMAAHRIKKALEGKYYNHYYLLHCPFLKDVVTMPDVQQAIADSKARLAQKRQEMLAE